MANGDRRAGSPLSAAMTSVARNPGPVLAGLLLAVVLVAIRAPGISASTTAGPWHGHVVVLAAVVEAGLAVLLTALLVLRSRHPRPGQLAGLLRQALLRAVGLAMAAAAVLAGISELRLQPHTRPVTPQPEAGRGRQSPPPIPQLGKRSSGGGLDLTYVVYGLLALALLAAIVAAALVIARRSWALAEGEFDLAAEDDQTSSLEEAVRSGRAALQVVDDARRAIIACYVAMEASLAGAGTARDAAETPDELLGRAVAAGLVHGAAAGRLTALFYEARFSSHPLPASARDEASAALDAISAQLRTRAAQGSEQPGPQEAGQHAGRPK